jgi:hypothetical protein
VLLDLDVEAVYGRRKIVYLEHPDIKLLSISK